MKIDLSGKKALVGGSSKGIGFGIARQLAESGASVCLMARDKNKLSEIINELPKNNYQDHEYLLVDFSKAISNFLTSKFFFCFISLIFFESS